MRQYLYQYLFCDPTLDSPNLRDPRIGVVYHWWRCRGLGAPVVAEEECVESCHNVDFWVGHVVGKFHLSRSRLETNEKKEPTKNLLLY